MARILIIDDNDSFREMLAEMLVRAGHEVSEAVNGKIGMELYYKNPSELVITDIYMPRMGGREVIIKLRQNHPDVKIIAISGGGDGGSLKYLQNTQNLGADEYLLKPFTMKELLEATANLIKK